ncbi:MAG TPA: hypothetical protein VEK12_00085 [Alphaproteobacteria bacterium]|nr:hypothetical protein [Alphaproteobacteria bacterium]
MSLATTEGRNAPAFAFKGQPKAAGSAPFRRLRAVRDMAYVLSAWAASWGFVILVIKGLSGLF